MKLKASGILRHRFWGDYSAVVVLRFEGPGEAKLALPKLIPPGSELAWTLNEKSPTVAGIIVDSAELEVLEKHLESLGAGKGKVSSLDHSVDHGDPFEITVEIEDPKQTSLTLS